jgi:hypothetical protein
MVSTPIGAEGLSFVDGKEILSRQSDAELSQACIALLRDDALCVRLGAAAREKAKSLYDARTVERQVEHIITSSILNLSS